MQLDGGSSRTERGGGLAQPRLVLWRGDRAQRAVPGAKAEGQGRVAHPYQPDGVELARRCAKRLGLSHTDIMTVAGHDSINMKDRVPTVMLFVPSSEGASHNEFEYTADQGMFAGVALLTEAEVVRSLAAGELTG
ncbi:M20/M25/M40 family metallo-hydrolase [Streptomyces inhibens]|uniref:M20/M25/M40 family metallo-hydrolase n=1 Tax=Streptomyces inhibens TaxID=2293571 RepID=UPI001EE6D3D8|nr:M20/M25/M40 family metallo-hydrolase [Streptomyces inhibens]UKY54520.1 M20/M25/M40 family metallo-hydrolase [Streptomyces inhibens]